MLLTLQQMVRHCRAARQPTAAVDPADLAMLLVHDYNHMCPHGMHTTSVHQEELSMVIQ